MKPKIVHLLDDQSVGGVRRWIETISDSRLNSQFEFQPVRSTELFPVLRSQKVALVICHNPSSWKRSLNLIRTKRQGVKLIIVEHHYCEGFEQINVPSVRRFRAMLKWNYGIVDRVASVSQGQSTWIQKHQLIQSTKLATIPLSTQVDPFLEVPKKQLQKPFILGAYGRFSQQKGFDTLLKAMQQISTTDVQLYLGGFGEDESLLRKLATHLPNVKFWGAVRDVRGFLSACDAIVIPSRWEPGGTVCIEAKAAGKPVIVSDVDGLPEQVQNCGIVVPPNDPTPLATAIETISKMPHERIEAWREAARNSVENAWEHYLAEWETFLWKLLGEV
ncbi:glycosyltransferase family 4 protein [Pseudanabaenaceae cyanobacterium LEGE 13415]|nr:glycosyltransferase family 4 protein [Pseudanabaenaceae cyanobacterium LEGE 13415]